MRQACAVVALSTLVACSPEMAASLATPATTIDFVDENGDLLVLPLDEIEARFTVDERDGIQFVFATFRERAFETDAGDDAASFGPLDDHPLLDGTLLDDAAAESDVARPALVLEDRYRVEVETDDVTVVLAPTDDAVYQGALDDDGYAVLSFAVAMANDDGARDVVVRESIFQFPPVTLDAPSAGAIIEPSDGLDLVWNEPSADDCSAFVSPVDDPCIAGVMREHASVRVRFEASELVVDGEAPCAVAAGVFRGDSSAVRSFGAGYATRLESVTVPVTLLPALE